MRKVHWIEQIGAMCHMGDDDLARRNHRTGMWGLVVDSGLWFQEESCLMRANEVDV